MPRDVKATGTADPKVREQLRAALTRDHFSRDDGQLDITRRPAERRDPVTFFDDERHERRKHRRHRVTERPRNRVTMPIAAGFRDAAPAGGEDDATRADDALIRVHR